MSMLWCILVIIRGLSHKQQIMQIQLWFSWTKQLTMTLIYFNEIKTVIKVLSQVVFEFWCVKGHQDSKCLSLPAKLNIECDWHATELLPHLWQHSIIDKLKLPNTPLHITTHGKTFIRDIPNAMCHATNTPDYQVLSQTKIHWTNTICNNINGAIIKMAM